MPKKKTEEEVVETANEATDDAEVAAEETAVEAQDADAAEEETAVETQAETAETPVEAQAETEETAVEAKAETEEKPKKSGGKKKTEATEATEETSIVDSVLETAAAAVETVANAVTEGVSSVVSALTGDSSSETDKKESKRAERIGIVASDKMTKTVTVRVDRLVKHPIYRKYVKRRKKFMAHDETGASIGDKVRIVETRPLSAKKRWRVVEIIQKAEK
ncbi:MAG TPA: 30S ribosomal protein S17 [Pyrinomonadaceae bacterium]|nr:30S ribosomal protein S17 [Pyrinomonadaceae bacterium]